jgi:hypothetical protein
MYEKADWEQLFTEWDEEIWPSGELRQVMTDKSNPSFLKFRNWIEKLAKSFGFERDESTTAIVWTKR